MCSAELQETAITMYQMEIGFAITHFFTSVGNPCLVAETNFQNSF